MAEPGVLAQTTPANQNRPPILKRTSYNSAQSTNNNASRLGSPRKERITLELFGNKSEPMAAAFLQYCAMCEKQITHPSNSILYCSEACRRKDSKKPLSAATLMSTTTHPHTYSPPASAPSSPRSILPPRLPTGVTAEGRPSSTRIPTDDHGFKSDLDPTEWKPNIRRSSAYRPASSRSRHDSEAFRYLQSFHRAISKNNNTAGGDDDGIAIATVTTEDGIRIDVPRVGVDGGVYVNTAPPTPSLGNTPTTTASSSWSASVGYGGSGTGGYDFNTRPLMPRHNRWYSSSSGAGYGVDLVTPHIPPPPTLDAYAKKAVMMDGGKQNSGLGAFFGGGME